MQLMMTFKFHYIFLYLHFACFSTRVQIEIPKVEVRYENLSVEGDKYAGSRALPTLLNATLNVLEVIINLLFSFSPY